MRTLNSETRERIVARMCCENNLTFEMASAIFDETLKYMQTVAENPGLGLAPSHLVDIGWHTFILYTFEYAQYCNEAFGFFLHHNPTDRPGEVSRPLSDTTDFFTVNGIIFDPELWGVTAEERVVGSACDSAPPPDRCTTCVPTEPSCTAIPAQTGVTNPLV